MKKKNEFVAVKCEGCFTEWYAPTYKDPFEDNLNFRDYYEEHIIDIKPVLGPSLGDSEDEFVIDDLQCHAERMCVDSDNWAGSTNAYMDAIEKCLADGKPRTWKDPYSDQTVKIIPYRKSELPPVNEESLKIYGPWADLMRERVAAI